MISSLRRKAQLEVSFLDQKYKELNYLNIMAVLKLWIFSGIGEIRKNVEVARTINQK